MIDSAALCKLERKDRSRSLAAREGRRYQRDGRGWMDIAALGKREWTHRSRSLAAREGRQSAAANQHEFNGVGDREAGEQTRGGSAARRGRKVCRSSRAAVSFAVFLRTRALSLLCDPVSLSAMTTTKATGGEGRSGAQKEGRRRMQKEGRTGAKKKTRSGAKKEGRRS